MSELKLKPCPFCGTPNTNLYFVNVDAPHSYDTVGIFCNACKQTVILERNEWEGETEETKARAIEAWNRRPDISAEEVKEHCRARNYLIVAAELFMRLARGITYRADEMPIDGTAAYRIGGDSKTLWLTVPNGSIKGDKIGNRVIVQEESTPFVKTYYTEDIAP